MIILWKRKKYFYTFASSETIDREIKMKQSKKNDYSYTQTFEKFMRKVFCAFIFVEMPVLRFRRPILPRA